MSKVGIEDVLKMISDSQESQEMILDSNHCARSNLCSFLGHPVQ